MLKKMGLLLCLTLSTLIFSACGQTGKLYLPASTQEAPAA